MTPRENLRTVPTPGRLLAGVLTALAAAVVGPAAWACVPQPYLLVEPRSSGPPGTKVEVVGTNFEAGPPEIRWNGIDGTLLGKASSPQFSLTVAIPDDDEGLYALVAVSRGPQGQVTGVTRAAFAVTRTKSATTRTTSSPRARSTDRSSSSPVPAMLLGATLTAAGGAGGAALTRRRLRRSVPVGHNSGP